MSAGRVQKSRSTGDVPDPGDPDRKRVLNVLAQRRYRQRRKEKIALLEAQTKDLQHLVDYRPTSSESTSPPTNLAPDDPDRIDDLVGLSCENGVSSLLVHEGPFDSSLCQDFNSFPILPTPLPSTPDIASLQNSPLPSTFVFPLTADGSSLSIPAMNLVQTFLSIATAFNVNEKLWDPFFTHVMPACAHSSTSLPPNLHPVSVQFTIPHHPALDLLPWPTMREKLIIMLSLPSRLRPAIAQEEDDSGSSTPDVWSRLETSTGPASSGQGKAIVQLIQDIDDLQDGGGLMVHGNSCAWGQGNEFVEEAWEVGESFYRKWWFCLDQKIVDQSNKRRQQRGLGRLRLTAQ